MSTTAISVRYVVLSVMVPNLYRNAKTNVNEAVTIKCRVITAEKSFVYMIPNFIIL